LAVHHGPSMATLPERIMGEGNGCSNAPVNRETNGRRHLGFEVARRGCAQGASVTAGSVSRVGVTARWTRRVRVSRSSLATDVAGRWRGRRGWQGKRRGRLGRCCWRLCGRERCEGRERSEGVKERES
jgi:hypothetical protein